MKELPKERIAELEREAEKFVSAINPPIEKLFDEIDVSMIRTGFKSAWLSCAKEYEIKLMEKEEEIEKLSIMLNEAMREVDRLNHIDEKF